MKKLIFLIICLVIVLSSCNKTQNESALLENTINLNEQTAAAIEETPQPTAEATPQPTAEGPYSYTEYSTMRQILDDALIHSGNTDRIVAAMQRAMNGEDIKIGVIGGSITWGASADIDKTYAKKIHRWWKKKFPDSNVKLVNAGKSGTGSMIGVHRLDQDLLDKDVDFVIVEFAVNDTEEKEGTEAYENLVREVLEHESKPGLMLLMMCADKGYSSEESKIEIGMHYDCPILSYKSSVYEAVERGELVWDEIAADFIHPDNLGHLMIAEMIIYNLEQLSGKISEEMNLDIELPEPITDAFYTNTKLLTNETLDVVSLGGFEEDNNASWVLPLGYKAVAKGEEMIFEVEAKTVVLVYNQLVNSQGANVLVTVDGEEYGIITSKSPFEWEAITSTEVLREQAVDKHTIALTFLDEVPLDCTGEEFKLLAVMVGE